MMKARAANAANNNNNNNNAGASTPSSSSASPVSSPSLALLASKNSSPSLKNALAGSPAVKPGGLKPVFGAPLAVKRPSIAEAAKAKALEAAKAKAAAEAAVLLAAAPDPPPSKSKLASSHQATPTKSGSE
jgi:hypothetical protein